MLSQAEGVPTPTSIGSTLPIAEVYRDPLAELSPRRRQRARRVLELPGRAHAARSVRPLQSPGAHGGARGRYIG
jgi:hypothetical protein